MIPGDRAAGIYTTGHLQNVVHLKHGTVGRLAVVVGAELVSYSAVLTLKHAGRQTALMTTELPSPESYAVLNLARQNTAAGRGGRHPHPAHPHHRQTRRASGRSRGPRH